MRSRRGVRCWVSLAAASILCLASLPAPAHAAGAAGAGSLHAAGARFFGSTGALHLSQPVVDMATTPSGAGYWLVASDGGVFAFGDARFFGSTGAVHLAQPIVGMDATPSGAGYWLVAADGGVFAFGDARFFGSTGAVHLAQPIVGMAATPSGAGYWLVASDGGVFAFGDARFVGSTGALRLSRSVVGMATTPSGAGYWLVASDGGVFAFGDARFFGSTGALHLVQPVVGITATTVGDGYWLAAADGGIFAFGNAPFYGSAGDALLNQPIVGMDATPPGDGYWLVGRDGGVFAFPSAALAQRPPRLTVSTVASGLTVPWDLGFTPDGTMLLTERPGRIDALVNGIVRVLAAPPDVIDENESGMMGLAIDPAFASNRTIYTCLASTLGHDVRVVKWTVNAGYTSATRTQELVTGLPNTGRHSGCRPRFGPDGFLWVGTGDAAIGTNAQRPTSLGGKILRVDTSTGAGAPGNLGAPFDSRIFSYGHRNVQGIAFKPGSLLGYSAEHGPDRDDEINLLQSGNFGWDPVPGYNESVPMTDHLKFPGAIDAVWSSGFPTIATSGLTFLSGPEWKAWNGALLVACLKGEQLRILIFDSAGNVAGETSVVTDHGRLRTPVQGPDGSVYVTTSNGVDDEIVRVTPS